MNISIKQAGENHSVSEEIEALAVLFDDYRIFYQQESDLNLAKSFLEARIKTNTSVIFYAQNSLGDYLGFTQLYPSFSSVSAQPLWILNDLYVVEEFRFKGVARALLNHAKDFASENQAKGLSLATAKDNIPAQLLYESLGYEKDEVYLHYFLPTAAFAKTD